MYIILLMFETDCADIPNDCSDPGGPTSSYEMTSATSAPAREGGKHAIRVNFSLSPFLCHIFPSWDSKGSFGTECENADSLKTADMILTTATV